MKLIDGVLPPGVLNVVNGRGSITGQALLEHPGIDKLTFTGSTSVGMSVGLAAARRVIPATLELGGKSAGIYFADMDEQDLSRAVDVIASGALVNSGQVCAMQSGCWWKIRCTTLWWNAWRKDCARPESELRGGKACRWAR